MHAAGPDRSSAHSAFATTRWSLIAGAAQQNSPEARAALEALCVAYWYPVYAYVRRRVSDVHTAQDLTQSFFARLLERGTIAGADPERGRFRAFLLTACKRFLINEWEKDRAAKRGGGQSVLSLDLNLGESRYSTEPADTLTPERLFERQWAITLLARVLEQLQAECVAKGRGVQFEHLKGFLSGSSRTRSHGDAAAALGMTESAAKVAAHRLRERYRELLRAEIAETVEKPEDVEDEIRSLFEVLGAG
jgi:RNA polymerase sigma-70 factor (ECF subfamily)